MLQRYERLILSLAQWPRVLLLVALYLAFGMLIFNTGWYPQLAELAGGLDILDNRFGYSGEDVTALFAAYGEAGRAQYRNFLVVFDFAYPLLFAVMAGALLAWLLRVAGASRGPLRKAYLAPLGMVVLDFIENGGELLLLSRFPAVPEPLVSFVSGMTMVKLIGVNLLFIAVLGLMVTALVVRFTGRQIAPSWGKS